MNTERKPPRKIDIKVREFNDLTLTMVCNLDDQLVRYIGQNLNGLNNKQVIALLDFIRGIRSLKKAMITFSREL